MKLRMGSIGSFWFADCGCLAGELSVAVLFLLAVVPAAAQDHMSDFVVFAHEAVTYQGFTDSVGAPVGTNGNLNHLAGIGTFTSLIGGGRLNGANTNARQRVDGDVDFFGDISINELSRVGGNLSGRNVLFEAGAAGDGVVGRITAYGTVDLGAFNQVGNIDANGSVTLRPSARVLGGLSSNGNVTLETAAKVDGHVIHAGTLTIAPLAMVGSSSAGSILLTPDSYVPVPIAIPPTPPPSLAPPIILPLFAERTFAPGHYSDLLLEGSNDLFLSAGDYYFNNIEMVGTFADLHLDLTAGPIRIFVHDDARFNRLSTFINGVPQATANPALAADVILEAHGHVTLSGEFFGGVFAPYGEVTLDTLTNVIGSVVAGEQVIAESSANVSYVRNNYLTAVPEPSALALTAIGFAAVCIALWRRRRIAS
jgi:adhesin HecA-like repeat protein